MVLFVNFVVLFIWRDDMFLFDVVFELDKYELINVVDNVIKELDCCFDLKGKCSFEVKDKLVIFIVEVDFMFE